MSRNKNIILEEKEEGVLEQVDFHKELADRNEEIKGKLQEAFDILKKEKDTCRALKSKEKMGGRFTTQLTSKLVAYGLLSASEFAQLTYEDIEAYFNAFIDLIAYYNLTFEIVPNKQLFCAFMKINIRMYSRLAESSDNDIRELMASIDDYFIGQAFSGGENGNVDGKAALNRLTFHGAGHGLIRENEKQAIDTVGNGLTEEEQLMKLQKLGIKLVT